MVGGSLYLFGGVGGGLDMDLGKFIYEASPAVIPEMEKTFHSFSDRRLKEHIEHIDSTLYKVKKLNGYNYYWMDGAPAGLKGYDIGLIAQEVEAVYPEIVQIDDSTGYKTIYYYKFIPVLVEAIKEQQKTIENQEQLIIEYQRKINQNEDLIKKILPKLEIE